MGIVMRDATDKKWLRSVAEKLLEELRHLVEGTSIRCRDRLRISWVRCGRHRNPYERFLRNMGHVALGHRNGSSPNVGIKP